MSVIITSPQPNQVCTFDRLVEVHWSWTGGSPPSTYRIEVSYDGSTNYVPIAGNVTGTSYSWHVRGVASNIAQMRVTALGISTSPSATVPITIAPPTSTGEVGLVSFNRVISAVGTNHEVPQGTLPATHDPNHPVPHILDLKDEIPGGARLIGGWYSPYHNVAALGAFTLIKVQRRSDTELALSVCMNPSQTALAKMRIQLFGLWIR